MAFCVGRGGGAFGSGRSGSAAADGADARDRERALDVGREVFAAQAAPAEARRFEHERAGFAAGQGDIDLDRGAGAHGGVELACEPRGVGIVGVGSAEARDKGCVIDVGCGGCGGRSVARRAPRNRPSSGRRSATRARPRQNTRPVLAVRWNTSTKSSAWLVSRAEGARHNDTTT